MASTILADNGVTSGTAGLKESADSSGVLALQTTTAGGVATTAVTIDTSQNVGFGNASPAAKVDAFRPTVGTYFLGGGGDNVARQLAIKSSTTTNSGDTHTFDAQSGTGVLAFATTGSERARIDSSGNLLVGTTSAFYGMTSFQNNNADEGVVSMRNSGNTAVNWRIGPNSGGTLIIYNQSSAGVYLPNGGTSWFANSDERLKTELIPFADAAQKVCSIRTGTGRYLVDDESVSRSFLIAQDVQAVLPEAVNVQDDEIGTLGLSYVDIIPLLTAAIQEQQALITSLTERITALEGAQA